MVASILPYPTVNGFTWTEVANPLLYADGAISYHPAVKWGENYVEIRSSHPGYSISAYSKDLAFEGSPYVSNGQYVGVSGVKSGTIFGVEKTNSGSTHYEWSWYTINMKAADYIDFATKPSVEKSNNLLNTTFSGDDLMYGTAGNDTLNGLGGNDKFYIFQGGNDAVSGGDGIDTAIFGMVSSYGASGASRSSYTITKLPGDIISVKNNGSTPGTAFLTSIEKLQFTDGFLVFDVQNTADNSLIYRLYQAAFGRTPDDGGFHYWTGRHDQGLSLNEMAAQFRTSAEFSQKFGSNVSTDQYVDLLYKNILGRAGEAGGVSYWTSELNTGHLTKDQVLIGFAGSPENVTKTAVNIDNGYWLV